MVNDIRKKGYVCNSDFVSHFEEAILKAESGINLNQKGEKKYRFNPPGGTLILTDQRLIFAQSGGEFAKRLVAGGLLGGIVGSEAMRAATRVNKEQLDEALKRPDSFEVYLQDIVDMRVKKEFGASLFCVGCSTPGMSMAHVYRAGAVSSFKGFDDWINEINSAKQRLIIPVVQQAPPPMAPPPPIQQPQPAPPPMAYPNPMPQPSQSAPSARFCPNCGQATNPQDKFCRNCGANFQAQPAGCPRCGNAVNPGQKFCNMCGAQLQ